MLGPILWVVVEIDEVAGPDIDGADAEAHLAVDAIEIDQPLQRARSGDVSYQLVASTVPGGAR